MKFDEEDHARYIAEQLPEFVHESPLMWAEYMEATRWWLENWCEGTLYDFFVEWLEAELLDDRRRDLEILVEDLLWKKKIDCPVCGGERTVTGIDESRISSNYEQPADYDAPCPLCCG